jgi:hypothetical protein
MRLKLVVLFVSLAMVFAMGACSKQDEAPITRGGDQPEGHPSTGGAPMVPAVTEVVVPENVKGKWDAVLLSIENKETGSIEDVKVPLYSEYTVPGSNLKVSVGDFLPDFRMEGAIITSFTPDPNNPAVKVKVVEGEEELFDSWLYSRFPAIHPFQHEKFGITLKDGIRKAG